MDGYAILIMIGGSLIYIVNRKRSDTWKQWGILFSGIGLGILIGAIWANYIVQNILNSPMP